MHDLKIFTDELKREYDILLSENADALSGLFAFGLQHIDEMIESTKPDPLTRDELENNTIEEQQKILDERTPSYEDLINIKMEVISVLVEAGFGIGTSLEREKNE